MQTTLLIQKSNHITNTVKNEEIEQLNKLLEDIEKLNELNADFIKIIGHQTENINNIFSDIIKTNDVIDNINNELIIIDTQKKENIHTNLKITTIGSTIIGSLLMITLGVKIGLIFGGSLLVGGTVYSLFYKKE
jgi:hypothetical protein